LREKSPDVDIPVEISVIYHCKKIGRRRWQR
jgi:hypothetical protein